MDKTLVEAVVLKALARMEHHNRVNRERDYVRPDMTYVDVARQVADDLAVAIEIGVAP